MCRGEGRGDGAATAGYRDGVRERRGVRRVRQQQDMDSWRGRGLGHDQTPPRGSATVTLAATRRRRRRRQGQAAAAAAAARRCGGEAERRRGRRRRGRRSARSREAECVWAGWALVRGPTPAIPSGRDPTRGGVTGHSSMGCEVEGREAQRPSSHPPTANATPAARVVVPHACRLAFSSGPHLVNNDSHVTKTSVLERTEY